MPDKSVDFRLDVLVHRIGLREKPQEHVAPLQGHLNRLESHADVGFVTVSSPEKKCCVTLLIKVAIIIFHQMLYIFAPDDQLFNRCP